MDQVQDKSGWHYTIVENEFLDLEGLPIYEKMIYIALKRYANIQTNIAFPGIKKLASIAGMSERKARDAISSLEEMRFISIERRENKTSIYTILPLSQNISSPARHAGGTAHGAGGVVHEVQGGGARGADELKSINYKNIKLKKDKDNEQQVAQAFDEVWNHYPNKKGKSVAFREYKKALKNGVTHETILDGVLAYKRVCGNDTRYIKHGSTWFNQKSWEDDYSEVKVNGRNGQPVRQVSDSEWDELSI